MDPTKKTIQTAAQLNGLRRSLIRVKQGTGTDDERKLFAIVDLKMDAAEKKLTGALREELRSIANKKARADYGDAVADALQLWADAVRFVDLGEWMQAKGWAALEADPDAAQKLEAAIVKAWKEAGADAAAPVSFLKHFDIKKLMSGEINTEEAFEWAYAFLTIPKGEPLPEHDEDITVLTALEGFKALLPQGCCSQLVLGIKDNALNPWLRLLAAPWIKERAAAEAERENRASRAVGFGIREKAETQAGNKWTPLPRALDIAAALGGPFVVQVDGETYAPEPELAGTAVGRTLRPRGWDIVPEDWLGNPAQMTLALDLDAPPEAVREYMIETATRTAALAQLPNMCPKLLGYMFAAAPMTGRPVKGTLLDLARQLYPDWTTRRQNKRDLQGLGAAFVAIKSLRLVETKPDGTRHPYDLFTVDYDLSCKPDAVLGFMLNPWLVARMKGGTGGGYFLLNMTRWLALGIQNPRLFPLALRLAALWDKARKDGIYAPTHLHTIEADRLAWECNTLPEGAAMYRAGKTDTGTARAALSAARGNLEADLDALQKAGLLGNWKPTKRKIHGKGFQLLPVPPADYTEACLRAAQSIRKAGHKPKR